jgi:hypothetical protein
MAGSKLDNQMERDGYSKLPQYNATPMPVSPDRRVSV